MTGHLCHVRIPTPTVLPQGKPTRDIGVEFFTKELKTEVVIAEEVKENVTVEHLQTSVVAADKTRTLAPSNNIPEWAIPKVPVRPSIGHDHMFQTMTIAREQDTVLSSTQMDASHEGFNQYLKDNASVMETPVPQFASTFMRTPSSEGVHRTHTPKANAPVVPAPVQNLFVHDDPNIVGTPPRRTTFIKDDPSLPESPLRRTTYIKPQTAVASPLTKRMPFTPPSGGRLPFTPPETVLEGEILRRNTFEKNDPNLPSTPIRRDTFYKKENACSNTPTIDTPPGQIKPLHIPRSVSPRSRPHHTVHFSDDTQVHNLSIPGLDKLNSSNLLRSGTYTKLNSSLSPKPPTKPHPVLSSPELNMSYHAPDIIGNIFHDMRRESSLLSQPGLTHQDVLNDSLQRLSRQTPAHEGDDMESATTATYRTPASTPYRSPVNSDSEEDDIFEDSVSFLPDQTSEWKSECNTIVEERVEVISETTTVVETVTGVERVWSASPDTMEGFRSTLSASGSNNTAQTHTSEEALEMRADVLTETVTLMTEQVFESRASVETHHLQPMVVMGDMLQESVTTSVSHSHSGSEQVSQTIPQDLGTFLRQLGKNKRGSNPPTPLRSPELQDSMDPLSLGAYVLPEYLATPTLPTISRLKRDKDRFSVDSLEGEVDDRSSPEVSDISTEDKIKDSPSPVVDKVQIEGDSHVKTAPKADMASDIAHALERTLKEAQAKLKTPIVEHRTPEPSRLSHPAVQVEPGNMEASPTSLLSESYSHQEVVEQLTTVKEGLRTMLSSTPVLSEQAQDKSEDFHAPSPIIGSSIVAPESPQLRRDPRQDLFTYKSEAEPICSDTVTKSRPMLLDRSADRAGKGLTVTKAKPDVLDQVETGGRSRKELFMNTPDSERRRRIRSATVTKSVSELSFSEDKDVEVKGSQSETSVLPRKSSIPTVQSKPAQAPRAPGSYTETLTEELLYGTPRKRDHSADVPHRGVPFQPSRGRTPLKLTQPEEPQGEDEDGRKYRKPWRQGQAKPRVSLSAGRAPVNMDTSAPMDTLSMEGRTASMDRTAGRRKFASGPVKTQTNIEMEGKGLLGSHKDRSLTRTQQLRRKGKPFGICYYYSQW